MLPDPQPVDEADVLLVESTYGDRLHEPDDDGERLAAIISDDASSARGKVIIPSFAIGRVEEVLYWIKRLEEEARIPMVPVYVDSPMAHEALKFYANADRRAGSRDAAGAAALCGCSRRALHASTHRRRSPSDDGVDRLPAIVISSSGMATGGRVLHHLADGAARHAQHGAVRRLPGGGHARPPAGRRRHRR